MKQEKFTIKLCDGTTVLQTRDEFKTYLALLKEIRASSKSVEKDLYDEDCLINNINHVSCYNDGAECILICNKNTFSRIKSASVPPLNSLRNGDFIKWNGLTLIVTEELNGREIEDRAVHILPNGDMDRKSEYNIYRF